MKLNIPGLLGAIGELPSVINKGLLGPLTVNPSLGLDPTQVEQARQIALQDMATGMLAAGGGRGGMNPGAVLALARANARENYSGRIVDMLREQEIVRQKKLQEESDSEKATLKAQIQAFRVANPQYANEPDAIILKRMDPATSMAESRLSLDQQQLAQSIYSSDRNYGLQEAQLRQQQANSDRNYELERLKMQADEQRFRANLRAQEGKVDPTEARQRRDAARSSMNMMNLLRGLDAEVSTHGTELFGKKAGTQGSLYGQLLSEYKQAKQLGTLDKGLLDLFDKMLVDPTSWGAAANPFAASKIRSQIQTLLNETQAQYRKDYEYLNSAGLADGLEMPRETQGVGQLPSLSDIDAEIRRRQQQGLF